MSYYDSAWRVMSRLPLAADLGRLAVGLKSAASALAANASAVMRNVRMCTKCHGQLEEFSATRSLMIIACFKAASFSTLVGVVSSRGLVSSCDARADELERFSESGLAPAIFDRTLLVGFSALPHWNER